MHNVWLLTKVLLKNTYTPLAKPGKKAIFNKLRYPAVFVCLLPAIFMFFEFFGTLFMGGYTGLGVQAGLLLMVMMCLITSLFTFPSIFYFSQDTLVLLPLPIKPKAIVSARLIIIFTSCLTSLSLFALPLWAAWIWYTHDVIGFILLIFESLFSGLVIMLILGILTILAMRFLPFFANKDRFNMIVGILSILFALGVSMGTSSMGEMAAGGGPANSFLMASYLQKGGLLPYGMKFFFWLMPAAKSIVEHSFLSFLISLIMPVVCTLLFFYTADKLYLAGAMSAMAGTAQKKKGTLSYKKSSYIKAGFINEMRILLRTPAYATNCVLTSFLMPIIMLLVIVFNPSTRVDEKVSVMDWPVVVLVCLSFCLGVGLTLINGGMNFVSSSAISREGTSGVAFMKSIPVSFQKQLTAKVLPGFLLTIVSTALYLFLICMLIEFPLWLILVFLAGVIITSWMDSWGALLCDGLNPRLVWDNETTAVKNNTNSVIMMLILYASAAILAGPAYLIYKWIGLEKGLPVYCIVLLVLIVGLGYFLWRQVPLWIEKKLKTLS